jgi:hypothetical protein
MGWKDGLERLPMRSRCSSIVRSFSHSTSQYLRPVILLIVLLGLRPSLSIAQQATIIGTVTDASGAVIANVAVTIANQQTGTTRTLPSNSVGQYVAPGLPIGTYDVKAEAAGFNVAESKDVILNLNDRVRVDLQMRLTARSETTTVEWTGVAVQADSGEQSSLLSGTQMSELSTNGRSIYTYAALTSGAASLMPGFQPPASIAANANLSFNGNRSAHNVFLLDGGENYDRGGSATSIIAPSIDAIAEMQTLTSNYGAEYGLSSAGTVSSVLKSGTRAFHFSFWEFFRNDALDARNFFNAAPQPVAELRYNLYGFNVGGPVTFGKRYNPNKTRTFFFYNMEWRNLIQGQVLNQTVPLPTTYGGNFSSAGLTLDQLHAPAVCQISAAVTAQFASTKQPLSGCTNGFPDPAKEVPFNNNTIPAGLLDANAQALLAAGGKYGGIFPAPNSGNSFIGGSNLPLNVREEIVRIDENVSPKLFIFGHLVAEQVSQDYGTTIFSFDNVPTVGNTLVAPSYAAVVHATYVFGPSLVNESSFNYNGNRIDLLPIGLVSAPSNFTFHRFFAGPNPDNRIPGILLGGSTGTAYSSSILPWHNFAHSYQPRDDVSWTKGRHQLKMGGSWLFFAKAQDSSVTTQGNFFFTGFYTGNDFADYLLGYANNYNENAVQTLQHWNSNSFALYFQDNYRVNRRLTFNLGLRWDGVPHTYDANKETSNFYPSLYNPANAALLSPGFQTVLPTSPGLGLSPNPILAGQEFYLNGVKICGLGGTSQGCVNGNWKDFGPRIGFAYDLTGAGKTVLRGGYAIMYERLQGNDIYNLSANVPFTAGVGFPNVSLSNPSTSLATGQVLASAIPVTGLTGMDPSQYAAPRSSQFSVGVQHAIGKSILSAAYVGSRNRHQNFYSQVELPPQSLLPGFVTSSTLAQSYNANVPYLGYSSITMGQNEANGSYNSLQLSLHGTALRGDLTYQIAYTYSQSYDSFNSFSNGGDLSPVYDPYLGWKYDYGPSAFDIRNTFFTDFVYQIPFMKHSSSRWRRTAVAGWEISGIVSATSGAPLNIGLAGQNVATVIPMTLNRPNVSGHMSNPHTVNEWFDTSVFSMPAPGTWGNTPADYVSGPGHDNWNLSFFKNFVFSEQRPADLQFRAEFFNVWNHTQWIGDTQNGGISTNYGSSNFGAVTSAADSRTIQLALKFSF